MLASSDLDAPAPGMPPLFPAAAAVEADWDWLSQLDFQDLHHHQSHGLGLPSLADDGFDLPDFLFSEPGLSLPPQVHQGHGQTSGSLDAATSAHSPSSATADTVSIGKLLLSVDQPENPSSDDASDQHRSMHDENPSSDDVGHPQGCRHDAHDRKMADSPSGSSDSTSMVHIGQDASQILPQNCISKNCAAAVLSADKQPATAESAVDPLYKKQRRLLRNRELAYESRQRKKSYIRDLEAKCNMLEQEQKRLQQQVHYTSSENALLKEELSRVKKKKGIDGMAEPAVLEDSLRLEFLLCLICLFLLAWVPFLENPFLALLAGAVCQSHKVKEGRLRNKLLDSNTHVYNLLKSIHVRGPSDSSLRDALCFWTWPSRKRSSCSFWCWRIRLSNVLCVSERIRPL